MKLAGAPIVCGSEPVMGRVLENSTSNKHSSLGSSSDKCAFSNSGNSAENVTKKDIQEFSHVLSNPYETGFPSESKMFKPQVSVTCQHECSQDGQPQNVPQVITNSVIAGSSPNENENVHSPNVPMFLLKVKSFIRSLQVKIYLKKSVEKKLKGNSWRLSLKMKKIWK